MIQLRSPRHSKREANPLQVSFRPHSSTFSTKTWTGSSSCPVFAFAFFCVLVFLSSLYGSRGSVCRPGWPRQTLPSDSFGSGRSIPCRPQLRSPSHSPGRLPGLWAALGIWPGQSGPEEKQSITVHQGCTISRKPAICDNRA